MWMRCGWDDDEMWMRCGWDVDEMWISSHNLIISSLVLGVCRVWDWCGEGWQRCPSQQTHDLQIRWECGLNMIILITSLDLGMASTTRDLNVGSSKDTYHIPGWDDDDDDESFHTISQFNITHLFSPSFSRSSHALCPVDMQGSSPRSLATPPSSNSMRGLRPGPSRPTSGDDVIKMRWHGDMVTWWWMGG